jgi:hypothetical protein
MDTRLHSPLVGAGEDESVRPRTGQTLVYWAVLLDIKQFGGSPAAGNAAL